MPLIIAIDEDKNTYAHIDGVYAIHIDTKGHSGLFLTIGQEVIINISKKLGLVTTSSAETEVVSCGERFPKCK